VKANQGAAGVDGQSIAEFEANLSGNLYKLWNRLSSAVHTARERCWRYDWVLDLDIKAFFDRIDWELMLAAIRHHTDCRWVLLYIERWLKAPMEMEDGSVVARTAGTPQGGVMAPRTQKVTSASNGRLWAGVDGAWLN
jgi:retron-type reverse transcriptase